MEGGLVRPETLMVSVPAPAISTYSVSRVFQRFTLFIFTLLFLVLKHCFKFSGLTLYLKITIFVVCSNICNRKYVSLFLQKFYCYKLVCYCPKYWCRSWCHSLQQDCRFCLEQIASRKNIFRLYLFEWMQFTQFIYLNLIANSTIKLILENYKNVCINCNCNIIHEIRTQKP